jgi:hypothetical protein
MAGSEVTTYGRFSGDHGGLFIIDRFVRFVLYIQERCGNVDRQIKFYRAVRP